MSIGVFVFVFLLFAFWSRLACLVSLVLSCLVSSVSSCLFLSYLILLGLVVSVLWFSCLVFSFVVMPYLVIRSATSPRIMFSDALGAIGLGAFMAYDPKMPFGDNIIQFNLRSILLSHVLFSSCPVLPGLAFPCHLVMSVRALSCHVSCLVWFCLVAALSCLASLWLSCLVLWLYDTSCGCLVVILSCLVLWLSCGCLVLWLSSLVVALSCGRFALSCLLVILWLSCLVLSFLVVVLSCLAFVLSNIDC
jgi:hypothetical protein